MFTPPPNGPITVATDTTNTKLAAVWRVFNHELAQDHACILVTEGDQHFAEYRFVATGNDASMGQLEGWWNESGGFPHPLRRFQDLLADLLSGKPVEAAKITGAQWGAYVAVMSLAFRVYGQMKREFDAEALQLNARRMSIAMDVMRALRGEDHRDEDVLRWWSDRDGQRNFETKLGVRALNANVGGDMELWDAQFCAYTVAIREVFNALDVLQVYREKAADGGQKLCRVRSRGKVLNVHPGIDRGALKELKDKGEM